MSAPPGWESGVLTDQALAALGHTDACITRILVYFLSKCLGHLVLRRTMRLHKRSSWCSLSLPFLSWKVLHPWGRLLFFECSHLSFSRFRRGLAGPLSALSSSSGSSALAAVNLKSKRKKQAGGGWCWSKVAACPEPESVTDIGESSACFRCLWEIEWNFGLYRVV